jgi:hypothetical protein
MSARSTIGFGNPYRFNTSSSNLKRFGAIGFNEQIFGADEQVSAGLVQKMHSVSN